MILQVPSPLLHSAAAGSSEVPKSGSGTATSMTVLHKFHPCVVKIKIATSSQRLIVYVR